MRDNINDEEKEWLKKDGNKQKKKSMIIMMNVKKIS